MRLRIYYNDFRALMTEIRDRVESGEWSTWRIDNHINAKGQRIRRLVPDFDYASPILDFSIFRGQNRHFCPRLVSFEHQTKA